MKSKKVFVGNLSFGTSWQTLKDHMRKAGEVLFADVFTDEKGKSKGCGLVEFAELKCAVKSIEELTDTKLDGRRIFVREDRLEEEPSHAPKLSPKISRGEEKTKKKKSKRSRSNSQESRHKRSKKLKSKGREENSKAVIIKEIEGVPLSVYETLVSQYSLVSHISSSKGEVHLTLKNNEATKVKEILGNCTLDGKSLIISAN